MAGTAATQRRIVITEALDIEPGFELRCSRCYKENPVHVCCECGKPLCVGCARLRNFFLVATPICALPEESAIRGGSVYCGDHWRWTVSPGAIAAVAIGVVAIIAAAFGSAASAYLMLLVAVLLVARTRIDNQFLRRMRDNSGVFGVCSRYLFETSETTRIDYQLGTGKPYISRAPVSGQFTISVKLDKGDKERFLKATEWRELHAGFFFWRGKNIRMILGEGGDRNGDAGFVEMRGPIPANFADLIATDSIGFVRRYDVIERRTEEDRPCAGVPLLVIPDESVSANEARSWGLTFRLHDPEIRKIVITSVILRVPPELRSVEFTDGVYESERSTVVWRDLLVTSESPGHILVEFAEPIHAVARLEATYEAEIQAHALGDLEVPCTCVWYANGAAVPPQRISIKQTARLSGSIGVATRLQPKRQEVIATRRISRAGLRLTVEATHQLLIAFARRGLAAKDVSESPAYVLPAGGGVQASPGCEVMGRYYVDNQPYDVHVIMNGEEKPGADVAAARVDIDVVVRNLSEWEYVRPLQQRVEAALLDLITAAEATLDDIGTL